MIRRCTKCGSQHQMIIENTVTGESEGIDLCYDCIFSGCKINHPEKIILQEFDEVQDGINMKNKEELLIGLESEKKELIERLQCAERTVKRAGNLIVNIFKKEDKKLDGQECNDLNLFPFIPDFRHKWG